MGQIRGKNYAGGLDSSHSILCSFCLVVAALLLIEIAGEGITLQGIASQSQSITMSGRVKSIFALLFMLTRCRSNLIEVARHEVSLVEDNRVASGYHPHLSLINLKKASQECSSLIESEMELIARWNPWDSETKWVNPSPFEWIKDSPMHHVDLMALASTGSGIQSECAKKGGSLPTVMVEEEGESFCKIFRDWLQKHHKEYVKSATYYHPLPVAVRHQSIYDYVHHLQVANLSSNDESMLLKDLDLSGDPDVPGKMKGSPLTLFHRESTNQAVLKCPPPGEVPGVTWLDPSGASMTTKAWFFCAVPPLAATNSSMTGAIEVWMTEVMNLMRTRCDFLHDIVVEVENFATDSSEEKTSVGAGSLPESISLLMTDVHLLRQVRGYRADLEVIHSLRRRGVDNTRHLSMLLKATRNGAFQVPGHVCAKSSEGVSCTGTRESLWEQVRIFDPSMRHSAQGFSDYLIQRSSRRCGFPTDTGTLLLGKDCCEALIMGTSEVPHKCYPHNSKVFDDHISLLLPSGQTMVLQSKTNPAVKTTTPKSLIPDGAPLNQKGRNYVLVISVGVVGGFTALSLLYLFVKCLISTGVESLLGWLRGRLGFVRDSSGVNLTVSQVGPRLVHVERDIHGEGVPPVNPDAPIRDETFAETLQDRGEIYPLTELRGDKIKYAH